MRAHWLARLFLHKGVRVRTRPQGTSERQGDAAALHEVYARHAGRHGPHRLLPGELLPTHGDTAGGDELSPQGEAQWSRGGPPRAEGLHATRIDPEGDR
jgi:hypothetical protein